VAAAIVAVREAFGMYLPDAGGEIHVKGACPTGLGIQDAAVADEHGAGRDVPSGDWRP
jgi:hypothetical protein